MKLVDNSFELGQPDDVVLHFCHIIEAPQPIPRLRIGEEELLIVAIIVVTSDKQPLRVIVYNDFYNKFQSKCDDKGTISDLLSAIDENIPAVAIRFPDMEVVDSEIQKIINGMSMRDVLLRKEGTDA